MNVAGADLIFLAWTGLFYFFMVFVIEKLNQAGKISQYFTHEKEVPYIEKVYDDGKNNFKNIKIKNY
jgi:hypothetical protein